MKQQTDKLMPKSSYQLRPIDAKEKATVEKILEIAGDFEAKGEKTQNMEFFVDCHQKGLPWDD